MEKETIKAIVKEPGKDLEWREIRNDLMQLQDLVGGFILNHALIHGHYCVAAGLINAGDYFVLAVQRKGSVHLVAVVEGIVHTDDFFHIAEAAKERLGMGLLADQLLFIGQLLKLAAAALAVMLAGGRIVFVHILSP